MFCTAIDLPSIWIDELSPRDQAIVMAWFAIECGTKGNNKKGEGNQYATYINKKAAVQWAHRFYRDAVLQLDGATLVLVEAAYKKTKYCPKPKKPITPRMLLRYHTELKHTAGGALMWGVLRISLSGDAW